MYTKKNNINFHSLYTDSDVLMFYIKSSDRFSPGKGHGEIIKDSHKMMYEELSKIDNWRQKLSDQWISPFKLNGLNGNLLNIIIKALNLKIIIMLFIYNFH